MSQLCRGNSCVCWLPKAQHLDYSLSDIGKNHTRLKPGDTETKIPEKGQKKDTSQLPILWCPCRDVDFSALDGPYKFTA